MPKADYLKRLEDKVNRAIDHIENLTVENQRLREENRGLRDSLETFKSDVSNARRFEGDRTARARDKMRLILRKIDSLSDLE